MNVFIHPVGYIISGHVIDATKPVTHLEQRLQTGSKYRFNEAKLQIKISPVLELFQTLL